MGGREFFFLLAFLFASTCFFALRLPPFASLPPSPPPLRSRPPAPPAPHSPSRFFFMFSSFVSRSLSFVPKVSSISLLLLFLLLHLFLHLSFLLRLLLHQRFFMYIAEVPFLELCFPCSCCITPFGFSFSFVPPAQHFYLCFFKFVHIL